MSVHPLRALLEQAARGTFPPADGRVDVLPAVDGFPGVVTAFTGHFVIAADVDPAQVAARVPAGDFSRPMAAATLVWLGEQVGSVPSTFDALLAGAGEGRGIPSLLREVTQSSHPRVARAARYRTDVRIFEVAEGGGVVVVGRGVCGRWEIGYEVEPAAARRGLGRRVAAAARQLLPAGEPVFAQVAPGNAASMRATVAAGFAPIGAEVVFPPCAAAAQ